MRGSDTNRYELKAVIGHKEGHGVALVTITDLLRANGFNVEFATLKGLPNE